MSFKAVGVLGVLLVCSGCSTKVERSSVIGTYVANHGKGLESIEVRADGTYNYSCQVDGRNLVHNQGRWIFHEQDGAGRLTFEEFGFCLPEYGSSPGYWDVEV